MLISNSPIIKTLPQQLQIMNYKEVNMKLIMTMSLLILSTLAQADEMNVERFQMNESELIELQRARLVKPAVLHSSCAKISSIDKMSPSNKVPAGKKVDLVLVSKKTRQTYLFSGTSLIYKFKSTFGKGYKDGNKIQEGDGRTPEGIYTLDYKNYDSKFHKSIHVSYPSQADRDFAKKHGVSPGGDIMLHGLRWFNGTNSNWTAGCVAMSNSNIDTLMNVVKVPTTVAICPL
jgi:murein L,D-transpeptidase YafK